MSAVGMHTLSIAILGAAFVAPGLWPTLLHSVPADYASTMSEKYAINDDYGNASQELTMPKHTPEQHIYPAA